MALENQPAGATTHPQNIDEKDERKKEENINDKLAKEIDSLKEIIKTKDYIIEDLFTDLGKVGSELDKFREKYEEKSAEKTPNENREKIQPVSQWDVLRNEINSLKELNEAKEQLIDDLYEEKNALKRNYDKVLERNWRKLTKE